jgi:TRAP transporter TAXI family solute receptor
MVRWLLVALAVGALTASCERGLPPASIKTDLEAVVDVIVPTGLLSLQTVSIVETKRASDEPEPGQRIVKFVALAKLNRAVDFSAWDQFSVAALANAFGTLPGDIGGIGARGNNAGDILTIPGTAIYERDSKAEPPWRFKALRPVSAPTETEEASYLGQLITLAGGSPNAWKIIADHPEWPPVRALALVVRDKGGVAVATGPVGSDRWGVIEALRNTESLRLPVANIARSSAMEEIALLRQHIVTAAIVDNDTADMAAKGEGPFAASGPYKDLRAIASLYPKPVHVVLNATSQVNSLNDLRGKRITVVTDGTGTTKIVDDLLRAYRLANNEPATTVVSSLPEALAALAEHKVDAVMAIGAAPQNDIAVATATHGFRLLAVDSDAIALLTSGDTHYLAASIPGRTYRGQQNAVATVAAAAVLVTDKNVPAAEIKALLQSLFSPVDYLRLGSTTGVLIKPSTALIGLPVPLHPGVTPVYETALP